MLGQLTEVIKSLTEGQKALAAKVESLTFFTKTPAQRADRREFVAKLIAAIPDALIVTGLGSASYDVFASGDRDGAASLLRDMVTRDRTWNEGAARTRLLQIFEAIGLEDPWVASTRRKLSTVLFG
jgi:putative thioredoxin